MPQMKKVLLDTDIGNDIDDALALAYLLMEPECELLGVTTVSGQPETRARMVNAICRAAGNPEIPVYAGLAGPLLGRQKQPVARQAECLCNWAHSLQRHERDAISFLRETVRANPGEVTLLGVGPLTNLAVLFAIDPEIPSLLRELVLMCGMFYDASHPSEWNAKCDPLAAAMVYAAAPAVHRSVGLDVTLQVTLGKETALQCFTSPVMRPVMDFSRVWFAAREKIVFHDPLAAMVLFEPELCCFERGEVSVVLPGAGDAGRTAFAPNPAGAHEVASRVRAEAALQRYLRTVGAGIHLDGFRRA